MKNILLRSISGAIYVALIVAGVLINSWTFLALCLLFVILSLIEYFTLELHDNASRNNYLTCILDVAGGVAMVGGTWLFVNGICIYGIAAYLIYLLARLITQLYIKGVNPVTSLSKSFLGQLYIALPLSVIMFIYAEAPYLVLAMFIFIWLNDTGAFIVGCSIGRHRLFPRLSPKKSWEGFWGGLAFCIAAAFVIKSFWPDTYTLTIGQMVGFAVVVSVFATWGDLVESMFKRSLNVKDSGKIIPGHGGILDRIDSLLCVIPAVTCYLLFM